MSSGIIRPLRLKRSPTSLGSPCLKCSMTMNSGIGRSLHEKPAMALTRPAARVSAARHNPLHLRGDVQVPFSDKSAHVDTCTSADYPTHPSKGDALALTFAQTVAAPRIREPGPLLAQYR